MKVKCLETFEQGMDRREGGMFKLTAGTVYSATHVPASSSGPEHYDVVIGDKTRTVPASIMSRLVDQKLVALTA